ncbi:MAG TPA: excinuclease ABC subunit C [Alphaproteobacteria bacterium]|nr:excinuclease ABC subunit C [Alphaproteobacteria bacterium]
MKTYYVYVLTDKNNQFFYTGVTNNIARRTWEHKGKFVNSYCKRYNINKLVYCEIHNDVILAIHREKLIKKWKRSFKIDAINNMNPDWNDLYLSL